MAKQEMNKAPFWYGKDMNMPNSKRLTSDPSEDEKYEALKQAIREEARQKWFSVEHE
ncbi:hypothetical protein N0O92_05070 [Alkalihalobacillus sp. MEB130]|uniref:hypothetical protein n=1 Tax=Alkalihalobacillus sp. MEB130 TaxID=2976704 RepID=UPI0028DEABC7|nr:hypothetical protein [Alkalihalobacillus sp. MEB130]MDT8859597.1 hypothetical protein [Alkalihalobacillus sp. MEB130]